MRDRETAYWDNEAKGRVVDKTSDNIWKRQHILARLMESDLIGQRILEVGVGGGTTFAAIKVILLGQFAYIGTDVSPIFCDHAGKKFGLLTCNTDILALPECPEGFSRIVCLDSLEHIKPEDRKEGFAEISRVMSEHGKILINMPVEETLHNREFDHEFGISDIDLLCKIAGCELVKYEPYVAVLPKENRRYVWVELER